MGIWLALLVLGVLRLLAAQPPPAGEDLARLRQSALRQDQLGRGAPGAYAALASALDKTSPQSKEHLRVLERGLLVSLRDADLDRAAWFAERLKSATGRVAPVFARAAQSEPQHQARVPGGLRALAFVAHGKRDSPPERFFIDYCRALLNFGDLNVPTTTAPYLQGIRNYFAALAELARAGRAEGGRTAVTLSWSSQPDVERTERVLDLLGWKARRSPAGISLGAAEKRVAARRHEAASALAIDEVAMQQTLAAGQPFRFDIPNEQASILLGEETWRAAFYPKEELAGGFAEALARDLRLAKLYLGLSALSPETASVLATEIGLRALAENYAELLRRFSSALATAGGAVVVPGGAAAAPVWTKLAGASPNQPPRFLRALLETDGGRLLAFFFALSQLDARRQRFLTRTAQRTAIFYELFRETPLVQSGAARWVRDAPLLELMRELVLDGQEGVRFPGGRQVWAFSSSESEDEVLAELARSRLPRPCAPQTELDTFLAVSRIDVHRSRPLDPASALVLRRNYCAYGGAYPYFAILTGLEEPNFRQFVAFAGHINRHNPVEASHVMGAWHALVLLLCQAQQSGALDERQAAALFNSLCQRFAQSVSAADFTAAALVACREILRTAAPGADPDQALRDLLLGPPAPPASFTLNGVHYEIDAAQMRQANYRRILELQKVPSLTALLQIYESGVAEDLAKLPAAPPPVALGVLKSRVRHATGPRTEELLRTAAAMRNAPEPRRQNLLHELLAELNAPVAWALTGAIYARFLNADDLLVAEDPLFLRKHEFVPLRSIDHKLLFPSASLGNGGPAFGSFLAGGLGDFAVSAGRVAAVGGRLAEVSPTAGGSSQELMMVQMGSIRASDCRALRDEDLRLFSLAVLTAREWVVQSAGQPALRAELADSALGLLSLRRRRELLDGVVSGDWKTVWAALTLSDLYFLGRAFFERFETDPFDSPVLAAARAAVRHNDGARLQCLGGSHPTLFFCSHPHLLPLAPYEEFERQLFPVRMAERIAELKLYLAVYLDSREIPASAFAVLAEPVARNIFRKLQMADQRDWHSVVAAFSRLDDPLVEEVLPK